MPAVNVARFMDKHVVLLYDREEDARNIQFEFLSMPLSLNKNAIYLTEHEPGAILGMMRDFGIDTDHYLSRNLLHVIQIPDFLGAPGDATATNEEFMSGLFASIKPPYYVVGRSFPDLAREGAVSAEVEVETAFHSHFARFNGACLCSYKKEVLSRLPAESRQQILHNHHMIVDASESGARIIEDSDTIR